MVSIVIFTIILPIFTSYIGAFLEFILDRNTDNKDWYRTPTKYTIIICTCLSMVVSVYYGISLLADFLRLRG